MNIIPLVNKNVEMGHFEKAKIILKILKRKYVNNWV